MYILQSEHPAFNDMAMQGDKESSVRPFTYIHFKYCPYMIFDIENKYIWCKLTFEAHTNIVLYWWIIDNNTKYGRHMCNLLLQVIWGRCKLQSHPFLFGLVSVTNYRKEIGDGQAQNPILHIMNGIRMHNSQITAQMRIMDAWQSQHWNGTTAWTTYHIVPSFASMESSEPKHIGF